VQVFRRDKDDDPEGISCGRSAIEAAVHGAAGEQKRSAEAEDWSEESDPAGGAKDGMPK